MKNLSNLAANILPTLPTAAPQSFGAIVDAWSSHSIAEVDAALDELLATGLVSLDESATCTAYYYRRDIVAEKATAARWDMKRRIAEQARARAIETAERAFVAAMDAADAERDAADPMSSLKAVTS